MARARPRRQEQEQSRVLGCADLAPLGGIERGQKPCAPAIGSPTGLGDLDPPVDDEQPRPLVDLMFLQELARRKLDDDRATLGLGIQNGRTVWLYVQRRDVPAPHSVNSILTRMVIAIDGPAGAGKSTVARAVARALGIAYLDSGAMYRCAALAALRSDAGLDDAAALGHLVRGLRITVTDGRVSLEGEDVTEAIRAPDVSAAASRVSVHPEVREAMVQRQRALIAAGDYVAEGRDIGTVVSPDATLKVFLTASDAERARRRAAETGESLPDVRAAQSLRDARDRGREHGALRPADDAVEIDTTGLSPDEVAARIADLAAQRERQHS